MTELSDQDLKWCLSRLPRVVYDLLCKEGKKLILAGGFIRSCVSGEKVNDIDLFTTDKDTAKRLSLELSAASGGAKVHESDNALSLKLKCGLLVQIIHRWTFDEPFKVVPSFDFTVAQAAIWFEHSEPTGKFGRFTSLSSNRFYQDLAAKRLVYTSPERNEDAGGSILRVLKFYQRGYRIPLDSLGAVLARLVNGVDFNKIEQGAEESREQQIAKVLTGLLREVDPNTGDHLVVPAHE